MMTLTCAITKAIKEKAKDPAAMAKAIKEKATETGPTACRGRFCRDAGCGPSMSLGAESA